MSTEDIRKAVVTVKPGVDVDALMAELTSIGATTPYVPTRAVEMFNEKPDSNRNFDVILTLAETELLRQDPRVVDVRWGTKEENGIFFRPTATDTSKVYDKTSTQSSTHYNWGIPACVYPNNPYSSGQTSFTYRHTWPLDGTGVDVVIQDSGILATHPEWMNRAGTASRLQQIDWPSASGMSGTYTQGAQHYTDQEGHGTHVAGTVAGKLYGWAKGSNIYAIKIFDTDAFGASASINMIRLWHTLKNGSRPTVVNMSWGYYAYYDGITAGNYRGTPWSGVAMNQAYGMVQTAYNYDSGTGLYIHPVRVSSVDADIDDAIAAGVVMIGAAGNEAHKIDVPTGQDYNNYWTGVFGNTYYHRGSSPITENVIAVGAISTNEYKAGFSNTGPAIDVFAPGVYIQSAVPASSTIGTSYSTVNYPTDSNFKSVKISGTSMASPQVAGVTACLLSSRPSYKQDQVLSWLVKSTTKNRILDNGSAYTDTLFLQSAPNRYLRQPFNNEHPLTMYNGASVSRA